MKKILILSLLMVPAFAEAIIIDTNTKIKWRSTVVESSLRTAGERLNVGTHKDLAPTFNKILEDLLQRDAFSLSDAASVCARYCNNLSLKKDSGYVVKKCPDLCKDFVNNMVNTTNRMYKAVVECKKKGVNALYVERDGVCVLDNPCKDNKYTKYCNRVFKDVQTRSDIYMDMVDLYAETHKLSCKSQKADSKLFGADFVVCDGPDVMVFEFDDIHNFNVFFGVTEKREYFEKGLCVSVGGNIKNHGCIGINEVACNKLDKIIRNNQEMLRMGMGAPGDVDMYVGTFWDNKNSVCYINISSEDSHDKELYIDSMVDYMNRKL